MKAITTKNVNLRSAALVAQNVLKTIPAQTEVNIIHPDSGGWSFVSVGGLQGYMSSQFLSVVPEPNSDCTLINRTFLYETLKKNKLFPKVTAKQIEGVEASLNEWEFWVKMGWIDNDLRKLAYILATDYHEGDKTMQPIKEYGGDAYFVKMYWTNQKKARELGNLSKADAIAFSGKGKPQLTGRANYTKMGKLLGYDLAKNPDLMLTMKIATEVMFEGMLTGKSLGGDFTGRHLGQYFNKTKNDPKGARAIVNGRDDDDLIAGYHNKFLQALSFV